MRRYKLSIMTFDMVGGVHFYGSVYFDGIKIKELEHEDPDNAPKWWGDDPDREPWTTIKFATSLDVVEAAMEWFLSASEIKPGDQLYVWTGYFTKAELKILRKRAKQ